MLIKRRSILTLALVAGFTGAAPSAEAAWYLPMREIAGDVDHIQVRMHDDFQFTASSPLFTIFGTSPDRPFFAVDWNSVYLNPQRNLLSFAGDPLDENESLVFTFQMDGTRDDNHLPRFHYQSYLEGNRVENHDVYVDTDGDGNLTDVYPHPPGTWDINHAITADSLLSGDANEDGGADGLDLLVWQNHYTGPSGNHDVEHTDGDFNGDGFVDGLDLLVWQNNYTGPVSGPPPLDQRDDYPAVDLAAEAAVLAAEAAAFVGIPEPGTAVALGLGLFTLVGRPRRRKG